MMHLCISHNARTGRTCMGIAAMFFDTEIGRRRPPLV